MKRFKSHHLKHVLLPTLAGLILLFSFNNCNSGFVSNGIGDNFSSSGQSSSNDANEGGGGMPSPTPIEPPPTSELSVDILLDDMRLKNDLPWALAATSGPKGWSYGPGYIVQGLMYGDSIANWFRSPDPAYISAQKFWNKVRPWWVVWPGQGHDGSNNFRVHLRNYETYLLRKSTGRWEKISYIDSSTRGWAEWYGEQNAPYGDDLGRAPRELESDGFYSIQPPTGNKVLHGGSFHYSEINSSDVIALHTRAEVRLVGADAASTSIKPLFQIGADYEPEGASPSQFGYLPSVGGSRLKLLTPIWKTVTFTTVRPNDVNTVNTPHNPSRKSYLTEAELRANPPPGVAAAAVAKSFSKIVATGSSSIDLWSNIENDLSPIKVIETGISGSIASDIYNDLNSLIFAHNPEAVMLYVGENDVASGSYSPTVTRENVRRIAEAILARIPQGKVFILSLKPSPLRIAKWPEFQTTNSLLKEYANSDARLVFIDVATPLLNSDGTPKASYYQSDRLHLSLEGYAVWTNTIRPVLLLHSGI